MRFSASLIYCFLALIDKKSRHIPGSRIVLVKGISLIMTW
jgi:hypothetical protein